MKREHEKMKTRCLWVLLLAAAVALAGCGRKYEKKELPQTRTTQAAEKYHLETVVGSAQETSVQEAPKDAAAGESPETQPEPGPETDAASGPGQEQDGTSSQPGDTAAAEPESRAELPQESGSVLPPSDSAAEAESMIPFTDVAGKEFYFSSGAGAWYTVLHIQEDGTFDGHYQDADMGDAGEAYPNGTLYYSTFSGSFTAPERAGDDAWVFRIASIEYEREPGTEEILDGVFYKYTDAYGLENAEDLYLYLPGAPISGLPESFVRWVGYYSVREVEGLPLPFYGLFNENAEEGFSTPIEEGAYVSPERYAVDWLIQQAEDAGKRLEADLQAAQTQADMNQISGQIYENWDGALNAVWKILKSYFMYPEERMAQLTEEERAWIAMKEEAVLEAGKEYEGGSMQAMVQNLKAAELTQERLYELGEYIS